MPQINLLQDKRTDPHAWQGFLKVLNFFAIALIVGLCGYYGYLFFSTKSNMSKTAEVQASLTKEKSAALNLKDRQKVLTRQAQLKELEGIISQHPYWSALLPALASATLKQASYMSAKADTAGLLDISVTVPDTQTLDKFLQVFDLPEYNRNFYNIKISSISNSQKDSKVLTSFNIRMNYNPALFKFRAVKNFSH